MSDLTEELRKYAETFGDLHGTQYLRDMIRQAAAELSRLQSLSDQNRLTGGWSGMDPEWASEVARVLRGVAGGMSLDTTTHFNGELVRPFHVVEIAARQFDRLAASPPLPLPGGEDCSSRDLSSTVCGDVAKGSDPIEVKP